MILDRAPPSNRFPPYSVWFRHRPKSQHPAARLQHERPNAAPLQRVAAWSGRCIDCQRAKERFGRGGAGGHSGWPASVSLGLWRGGHFSVGMVDTFRGFRSPRDGSVPRQCSP